MARYIDADALMKKCLARLKDGEVLYRISPQEIDEFPTADVADVVRCKDCKHFGRDMGHGKHDCKKYEMPYCLENDYCSYGERRTDDKQGN